MSTAALPWTPRACVHPEPRFLTYKECIAASKHIFPNEQAPPFQNDGDDSYGWSRVYNEKQYATGCQMKNGNAVHPVTGLTYYDYYANIYWEEYDHVNGPYALGTPVNAWVFTEAIQAGVPVTAIEYDASAFDGTSTTTRPCA